MGEKYFPCSKTTWLLDHNEGADIVGTLESRQSEKNGKSKSCTRVDFVISSEGDIIIIIIFGCVFVLFCDLLWGRVLTTALLLCGGRDNFGVGRV